MNTAKAGSRPTGTRPNGKANPSQDSKPKGDHPVFANLTIFQDKTKPSPARVKALSYLLEAKLGELNKLTPGGQSASRIVATILKEVRKNPKLLECTWESIYQSSEEATSLGLTTDGVLGFAYLVPYDNWKVKAKEAQLQIGYRGLIELARRESPIILKTRCVYEGDSFSFEEGDEDFIKHVPDQSKDALRSDDLVTHVYLTAKDKDGRVICRNVWSRAQIEAHKEQYSPGWTKETSPWQTAWSEMARKTVIRDSVARGEIPIAAVAQELAVREEIYESEMANVAPVASKKISDLNDELGDDRPDKGSVIDAEFTSEDDSQEIPDEEPEVDISGNKYYPAANESPGNWEHRIYTAIKAAKSQQELQTIDVVVTKMREERYIDDLGNGRLVDEIIGASEGLKFDEAMRQKKQQEEAAREVGQAESE